MRNPYHLLSLRFGSSKQGGAVCVKANMCSTPRRATLSLAGSARKELAVIRDQELAVIRDLGRRFYGR